MTAQIQPAITQKEEKNSQQIDQNDDKSLIYMIIQLYYKT